MAKKKSDEIRGVADWMLETLRQRRTQGDAAYPLPLSTLVELAQPFPPEMIEKALKNRTFTSQTIIACKNETDSPVVLKEDSEQLAGSDFLLEYRLRKLSTAEKWKHPISKLTTGLHKDLKPLFLASVQTKLDQRTLPPAVGILTERGKPQFYLTELLPPEAQSLVLAEKIAQKLHELRDTSGAPYPLPLDQLPAHLETPPGLDVLHKALKEKSLRSRVILSIPNNLASLVALTEDAERLVHAPHLLEFLLASSIGRENQAISINDLKKKLDKKLQRDFEKNIDTQTKEGQLRSEIGCLTINKKKYFFFLNDIVGRAGENFPATPAESVSQPMPPQIPPDEFEQFFTRAFQQIDQANGSHNFVSLVELRQAIPCDRAVFDAALQRLRREGKYSLSAAEGRHGISDAEREAGIHEAGTLLLYVSRRG